MQQFARGWLDQQLLLQRGTKWTKIQSVWRQRNSVSKLRQEEEASITIQVYHCRNTLQTSFLKAVHSVKVIQIFWRIQRSISIRQKMRLRAAAVSLQSWFCELVNQIRLKHAFESARLIQCTWRNHSTVMRVLKMNKLQSALIIQRFWLLVDNSVPEYGKNSGDSNQFFHNWLRWQIWCKIFWQLIQTPGTKIWEWIIKMFRSIHLMYKILDKFTHQLTNTHITIKKSKRDNM